MHGVAKNKRLTILPTIFIWRYSKKRCDNKPIILNPLCAYVIFD